MGTASTDGTPGSAVGTTDGSNLEDLSSAGMWGGCCPGCSGWTAAASRTAAGGAAAGADAGVGCTGAITAALTASMLTPAASAERAERFMLSFRKARPG
ncbi:hypothetical protein BST47_04070 [Mycolicibacterium tusciae]|uniref:Uncharacterized protein n=1 Tax=Mycolicibacterium tusciae TaxID=75922 RepID=A0A1X0JXN7_9MYCO|nr:hypothetical protein BST47_04070 [Mycolicibacterium tusciae]